MRALKILASVGAALAIFGWVFGVFAGLVFGNSAAFLFCMTVCLVGMAFGVACVTVMGAVTAYREGFWQ